MGRKLLGMRVVACSRGRVVLCMLRRRMVRCPALPWARDVGRMHALARSTHRVPNSRGIRSSEGIGIVAVGRALPGLGVASAGVLEDSCLVLLYSRAGGGV